MAFSSLLIHTVTIYNRVYDSSESRYGDPVETFDEGTSSKARVEASATGGQARERIDGRDVRSQSYTVFLPAAADVDALSVIAWDGRRLAVFGEPSEVFDGTGLHHIELTAQEVTG